MKNKLVLVFSLVLFLGFFFVPRAHAFEFMQSDEVVVDKNTVIKGSLFAGGKTVTIDGTVDGDLFCAAQTVFVRGKVNGDVLCAAQAITVTGSVGGSIRSIGQMIDMSGPVRRGVMVAGQTLQMGPSAVISGEAVMAGQTLTLNGPVNQDVVAAGQNVHMNSMMGGNVISYGQTVSLGDKARVAGNFTYTSPTEFTKTPGATILGNISHVLPEKDDFKATMPTKWIPQEKPWPINALPMIIFYMIVALIIAFFMPEKVVRTTQQMMDRPWLDMLIGFLAMIVVPVVVVLFAITIIGIPAAILIGLIFGILVFLSKVYVSFIVGEKALAILGQKKANLYGQAVVGVIITGILFKAPIVGFILGCVAMLWGLGGILVNLKRVKAKK